MIGSGVGDRDEPSELPRGRAEHYAPTAREAAVIGAIFDVVEVVDVQAIENPPDAQRLLDA